MKVNNYEGVSVIVCCYNSSKRISKTLKHLAEQKHIPDLLIEVILVDNGSTDNTAEKALTTWGELNSNISLRVVKESKAGLSYARKKGVEEALYSIVLFCDDDNWLTTTYCRDVYEILQQDERLAACGGMGVPIFETEEPFWFYAYAEAFALGSQRICNENGRILNLYGAGLAVKKYILEAFYQSSVVMLLEDRVGNSLSSSGDIELTYSFILMGYELTYSDELKFFHYLPKERLTFQYLKKLFASFGSDGPVRNLYYSYITGRKTHQLIKSWQFHFGLSVLRFFKYLIIPPKKYGRMVYVKWSIAYIKSLLNIRKNYSFLKKNILAIQKIKAKKNPSEAFSKFAM